MNNKKAFVLMPFLEPLNSVYEYLIKSTLQEAGYEVKRADDILSQSNILEDIVQAIVQSDLIIADLTTSNANVYYELGISHALDKKVVLLTQEISELPFDLRSYRVLSYSTHFEEMMQAKKELLSIASAAIDGQIPFGNPVKDYGKFGQNLERSINEDQIETSYVEELGYLDHVVGVEENLLELTKIVELVSETLADKLTPEITNSSRKLNQPNLPLKQKRDAVKALAKHVDNYAKLLKPKNEDYKKLSNDLETSLEVILSSKNDYEPDSIENIESFLRGFEALENGAQSGRDGFSSLLDTMSRLPNLEASFDQASKEMQREIKLFIDNIDQTIALAARARALGRSLISKIINSSSQKKALSDSI
ncbi:hypothetical protein ACM6XV_000089 [Vibrio vulnificus]